MTTDSSGKTDPRDRSAALFVLGMHRSGTSALAKLLHDAGASVGDRVLPASAGNESGHWEDAFAVETNERVLAALGRRWDDIRPLPPDWQRTDAVRGATAAIADYIANSRLTRRLWAIKDPRMCLLAAMWIDGARMAGCTPSAVLLARHPREVMDSLAARDGMAPAHGALLWLRYMVEAERASRGLNRQFLTYDGLVQSPAAALDRLHTLPGWSALRANGGAGDAVDPRRRRHRATAPPPSTVEEVWAQFRAAASAGALDTQAMDEVAMRLAQADRLYAPVLDEIQRHHDELWRRTARAEAAIVDASGVAEGPVLPDLCRAVAQWGDGITAGIERVLSALSGDIRRMQQEHARALASAAAAETAREESERRRVEMQAQTAMREAELLAVRQEVAERDTRLREADALMADMRQQVADRDAWIAERDAEIAGRNAKIADLAANISDLRDKLAERDEKIAGCDAEIADRDRRLQETEAAIGHLQRRVGVLESDLRQVLGSRSWKVTRPIRLLRRIMTDQLTAGDRERIRHWTWRQLARMPLPTSWRERMRRNGRHAVAIETSSGAAGSSGPFVARADASKADVFVWAVIDWHFRTQRPQHLARGLADAGHRVFYLSNNLVDDETPGFRVETLDESGRLFQVFLNAKGAPAIYFGGPSQDIIRQLRRSAGELMQWADSDGGLCIVQHPFWSEIATALPGTSLLYDCMDHHAGFEDNAPDVLAAERKLIEHADLLVVTSDWLDHELAPLNPRRALIRNAGDYAHFCHPPAQRFVDPAGRRILGYYGAIAEWFDVNLVRQVARAYPDCLVLLVGNDTAGVGAQLANEPNVQLIGEVPYARLPFYLYAFDVALLPFRVIPLTLATNPVKVYEYLGAGKPVVSVDLPEIAQFGDLVRCASDNAAFVAFVGEALEDRDPEQVDRRKRFASEQTWAHRALELDNALDAAAAPLVSVIVLTYNNLEFTQACLRSVVEESRWPALEVIVVDNASTDGSREFLAVWERQGPGRRVILNDRNLGFAAGNNVGLAAARGDYLILLNNDTYVTPHWIRTMVNHLSRNPDIGLLGPVTNNIGNEARIDIHYADMEEMKRTAGAYVRRHAGQLFDIPTVAFFCVAMRRPTYEKVGPLDEQFGVGFFEDDDYCRRVEAAGLRVVCADDVFVHHHLSASFDALKAEKKRELFERNKALYEAKWGPWTPHRYRARPERDPAQEQLPPDGNHSSM